MIGLVMIMLVWLQLQVCLLSIVDLSRTVYSLLRAWVMLSCYQLNRIWIRLPIPARSLLLEGCQTPMSTCSLLPGLTMPPADQAGGLTATTGLGGSAYHVQAA